MRRRKELRHLDLAPVVVHQMGKVGSSSVVASIRGAEALRPVFQIHHLTHASIAAEEQLYRSQFASRRRIDAHLLDAIVVRRMLDTSGVPDGTVIVTMVRDPMAQRFSAFFQTLGFRIPRLEERVEAEDGDALSEEVIAHFHEPGWWHEDRTDLFFSEQFKPVWDIDVLGMPFDRACGWRQYSSEAVVLLIRFENLASAAPFALSQVGVACVPLPHLQDSSRKAYSELLATTRSRLRLSASYLDRAYSGAVRHFYDSDELEAMKRRWKHV